MLPAVNFLVLMPLGAVSMVNLFNRFKKKKPTSKTKEASPQIQSQQPTIITQQQGDYIVTWAFMTPEKEEIGSKPPFSSFSKQKTKPAFNNGLNEYQSTSTPSSKGFSNPRLDMLDAIRQKLEERRKMIEEPE